MAPAKTCRKSPQMGRLMADRPTHDLQSLTRLIWSDWLTHSWTNPKIYIVLQLTLKKRWHNLQGLGFRIRPFSCFYDWQRAILPLHARPGGGRAGRGGRGAAGRPGGGGD